MREVVVVNRNAIKPPAPTVKKPALKNSGFPGVLFPQQGIGMSTPMSQPWQLAGSNGYFLLTLSRVVLTYAYTSQGIAQTIIDQPVQDAFAGGFKIKTDELDPEEIDDLQRDLLEEGYLEDFKEAVKWKRLFGGGGLIINDGRPLEEEFNLDQIDESTPLRFIPADRWELLFSTLDRVGGSETPYNYYGEPVHRSRVIAMRGPAAPSFVRPLLQGWGLSVLECLLRNLNSYTKNEEVVYELLDEAKIDVWKIRGFNTNHLSAMASGQLVQRMEIATQAKNYHNAVIMDAEDDYDQKQISMSGLGDILEQIRIGMAAAARIPMAKLFGLSAAGFNSGEDDIENYNAIVESTVRAEARRDLHKVIQVVCMKKFGFAPEIELEFRPLRILSAEQSENVKNARFQRARQSMMDGYFNAQEYWAQLKADEVFSVDTEVSRGEREPEPPMALMDIQGGGADSDDTPEKGNSKTKEGKFGK